MGLAFTHLIPAWFAGKVFEKCSVKLRQPEWALLLLGAVLPDIDLLIQWTTKIYVHRYFTHSLFFLLVVGVLVYIVSSIIKNKELRTQVGSLALMLGVTTHIIIDMMGRAGVQLLWPYPARISFFGVMPLVPLSWPINNTLIGMFILDSALGLAWIGYLMLRKRLRP